MQIQLSKIQLALVNRRRPTLFPEDACPHVARIVQQKLNKFGGETVMHPPYSPNPARKPPLSKAS